MKIMHNKMQNKWRCVLAAIVLGWAGQGSAQNLQAVSLMEPQKPRMGWEFGNGPEFPGATGSLEVDPTVKQNGRDTLKLAGDFTKGGNYVQAGRGKLEPVDVREISFWVKNPDATDFTLRINDSSGQTHQIKVKTQGTEWERIVFPVERFFANRGRADAVTSVTKYEYWGGAKDGNWHGPATGIWLLLGRTEANKVRTLWLQDIVLTPRPPEAPAAQIVREVPLDEILEGQHFWRLDFPPTNKATLDVVKDQPTPGQSALKFSGDFSKGGGYVAMVKSLKELELDDVTAIRVKMKTENAKSFGVQLTDGSGQTHQKKGIPLTPDGQWHEVVLKPSEIAGGEHWGGANDGQWKGRPAGIVFNMNDGAGQDTKLPVIYLADLRADAVQRAVAQPPAFRNDFEAAPLGEWTISGDVAIDNGSAFKGKNSLRLARAAGDANTDRTITATGQNFAVTPGQWQISAASKAELRSPDASYSGVLNLEVLDGAGKVLQSTTLVDTFGQRNWQPISKTVEVPKGAASARFAARLNKAAGQFWVDELAAAFLAPAPKKDNRIARVTFDTAQMGNLLFPNDARTVKVTLEAIKPLRDAQKNITCVVRDYWGAEQTKALPITLEAKGKKGDRFAYEGSLDLATAPLEIGRYYEIHAAVPQEGDDPYRNYSSFAILPEAITRQYKPEEIPFASRSWDNRPTPHIVLTDRLGIRICGLWGGWDAKAPYKANVPQLDLVQKLGMGWLTGTPAHSIEQGKKDYDETALRQGVRNLIEQFGKVRPMIINLGNEPHGTGQQVLDNVAAYKAIYEEVKKVDPTITVVATSVEPNEEYFKAGYGKYCDAYDFHIYETPQNVRNAMREYKALMKKYDVVKPIWSTELGLNSQGMTRHAVATEVVKKFVSFFAEGGVNVTWFGLMYPDSDTKNTGSSSEAHNLFDTRYGRYAPKLDAIADYNMINAIAIKKFVAEKQYPGGVSGYLFRDRDNRSLQVFWKDKGRADVALPLPGAREVQIIRIDGTRRTLNAGGKGVALSIGEDPILVLYEGNAPLPETFNAAPLTIAAAPAMALRGAATALSVALNGANSADVNLQAPPFWSVEKKLAPNAVQFVVTSPEASEVREADFTVTLGEGANRSGELYWRPPVAGKLAMRVLPEPASGDKAAGVKLVVTNNSKDVQQVSWDLMMGVERSLTKGDFGAPQPAGAYFAETATGTLTINPASSTEVIVPLASFDPLKIYRTRAAITDANGRTLSQERNLSGAVRVPKAAVAPKLDGTLDEAAWQSAPVQKLDKAEQFFAVSGDAAPWKGAQDLSANLRFLWDEKYLYVGVDVTDDAAGKLKDDASIWAQDGLQFLIDPSRESSEKPGKYDYGVALSSKGNQAWRFLSADAALSAGEAKEILVSTKRKGDGTGAMTYEVAFPWSSLAPFKPAPGANLGLTMAINEDDGTGRKSFITWFGNAHSKQLDTVGDLILAE